MSCYSFRNFRRQLHVLDETYLINQVKEDLCFVSTNFWDDMEIAKKKFPENTIVRDYVLPDYSTIKRGYIRPIEKMGTKPAENEQVSSHALCLVSGIGYGIFYRSCG